MSQISDKAFELGKAIMSLRRRVQSKKEVLVHQSCDDILNILEHVKEDVSEAEEKLKKISYVIEWTEADVDTFLFWNAISQWAEELEDHIKEEV